MRAIPAIKTAAKSTVEAAAAKTTATETAAAKAAMEPAATKAASLGGTDTDAGGKRDKDDGEAHRQLERKLRTYGVRCHIAAKSRSWLRSTSDTAQNAMPSCTQCTTL
jgi:hypothetical protein